MRSLWYISWCELPKMTDKAVIMARQKDRWFSSVDRNIQLGYVIGIRSELHLFHEAAC